jgi:hypothetical protein
MFRSPLQFILQARSASESTVQSSEESWKTNWINVTLIGQMSSYTRQRIMFYQAQCRDLFDTFYRVLCWIFLIFCHLVADFERRSLEIFCKINLDQTAGIHNNNLDCKRLGRLSLWTVWGIAPAVSLKRWVRQRVPVFRLRLEGGTSRLEAQGLAIHETARVFSFMC